MEDWWGETSTGIVCCSVISKKLRRPQAFADDKEEMETSRVFWCCHAAALAQLKQLDISY